MSLQAIVQLLRLPVEQREEQHWSSLCCVFGSYLGLGQVGYISLFLLLHLTFLWRPRCARLCMPILTGIRLLLWLLAGAWVFCPSIRGHGGRGRGAGRAGTDRGAGLSGGQLCFDEEVARVGSGGDDEGRGLHSLLTGGDALTKGWCCGPTHAGRLLSITSASLHNGFSHSISLLY